MKERLIRLLGGVPKREHEAWLETAAQTQRNCDYYRGLVVQIGDLFGDDAKTSDDGSLQQDVLCAKVPELVRTRTVIACTKTDGCWMREGHGGGCREWHGLCFSTMHQHELKRKREERDRKALEELTGVRP